ncbi:MAG: EAL domain-containing protein [Capsulimonadales bacterium]|nr:EAL domain-containing protein [Capsulimonadales bacterium]
MSGEETTKLSPLELASHNRLHQRMISLSGRLDRQVEQLTRLNRLSNRLLGSLSGSSVSATFAEAIADVLDVAIGAVWVLPHEDRKEGADFSVFGATGTPAAWAKVGEALAEMAAMSPDAGVFRPSADVLGPVSEVDLVNPLAGRCVGRDGATIALILAANTGATDRMCETINDETGEMLKVLAEKCAAHLNHAADRRMIEHQLALLRESEARLELVLNGTNDGWWDWDVAADTCFLSARWRQMVGDMAGQGIFQKGFWRDRVHEQDRPRFDALLEGVLGESFTGSEMEVRLRREDDTYIPVLVRGTVLRDRTGRPTRFAGSILDLSERKRYESHVHQLAFFDPLTDLPNRRLLSDRLRQSLLSSAENGQAIAVLMIDLDRFKRLNDTHGHAAGDQLLCAVARRLRDAVRPYDTVARLGGDEFVILLEHLGGDPTAAVAAAQETALRVLHTLDEPFVIDVGVVHHSGSVGVAVAPAGVPVTVDSMLRGADVALYEAKEAGRNMVRLYQPEMQHRVDRRATLEASLRQAFRNGEVEVHYQAQVDASGRLFGAEALMRWRRADDEPIHPSEFIPVAEESGFIHALGGWSLETACAQLVTWGDLVPPDFRLAVNLSAPEFMHPDFPKRVVETLAQTGVSGRRIRLEITEATVVTEMDFVSGRMNLLRRHGIEFALDDFGSGFSSLTYLRRLPVNEVKIDRSYIRRILSDPHDAAIVRAILAMCTSLNLRVVAEGVETKEQYGRLLDDGCRFFQGFYFARPKPAPGDPRRLVDRPVSRRLPENRSSLQAA